MKMIVFRLDCFTLVMDCRNKHIFRTCFHLQHSPTPAPLPPPFGWVETINVVKRVTADSESNWCPQMFNVLVQCIGNSITNNTNALAMVLLSNRNVLVLVLRIVQGSRIGIRKCFNHTQLNHLGHSCTLILVLLYTFWELNSINQPSLKRITS